MQASLADLDRAISDEEKDLADQVLRRALYNMTFLPSQKRYLDAINAKEHFVVLLTAGNKLGKSWVLTYDLISESLGYQPHDGTPRARTGYDIALLLRDYDNHANKILREGFQQMLPRGCVKVCSRTQSGAPRIIEVTDPITNITGKQIHIYTHDQDWDRLEGGSFQRVCVDEPCPQSHWKALIRSLQTTGGICTLTMTLLAGSEWIWNEIYHKASNNGGNNKRFYAITAFPEENRESQGGFLPDNAIDDFRSTLTPEEIEARVHGRAIHLTGRVYKDFDERVHVLKEDLVPSDALETCPKILVIDPHDRLPFAMIWAYITPADDIVIYDEWPQEDFEHLTHALHNFDDYAAIIDQKGGTLWNIMDPNYGNRPSVSSGMTVAQELSLRTGRAFLTDVNDRVAPGHLAVRNRLHWNTNRPMDATNQPKLYVKKSCRNVIHSFNNYLWEEWRGRTADGKSPKNKPQEKFKHFMDCIRYLCMHDSIRYVETGRRFMPRFANRRERGWSETSVFQRSK